MGKIKGSYMTEGYKGKKKTVDIIAKPYEYILATLGCWESIISDETITLNKGEIKAIKIKPLELKPEEIIVSCPLIRNAIGCVLSIGADGLPKRVEQARRITFAIFCAYQEGKIEKDELLGVVNVFSTAVSVGALARILLKVRYAFTHFARPKIR